MQGLSPRMRGHRPSWSMMAWPTGTIPAHGGSPRRTRRSGPAFRDYPRACGVTAQRAEVQPLVEGLSPRMRGHHAVDSDRVGRVGTIPAHAGSPLRSDDRLMSCGDYPRACGVTEPEKFRRLTRQGLSPRMRGHQIVRKRDFPFFGTIPAHAGSPTRRLTPTSTPRDYPRACGVTLRRNSTATRS